MVRRCGGKGIEERREEERPPPRGAGARGHSGSNDNVCSYLPLPTAAAAATAARGSAHSVPQMGRRAFRRRAGLRKPGLCKETTASWGIPPPPRPPSRDSSYGGGPALPGTDPPQPFPAFDDVAAPPHPHPPIVPDGSAAPPHPTLASHGRGGRHKAGEDITGKGRTSRGRGGRHTEGEDVTGMGRTSDACVAQR
eukprot:gene13298-biopygen3091